MAVWGFRAKCWSGWGRGFEEKEGVMRNAMTTRAPCGANKNKCDGTRFLVPRQTFHGRIATLSAV